VVFELHGADDAADPMRVAKSLVEVASSLEAGILVHHSGVLNPGSKTSPSEGAACQLDALEELAEFSRPHGVRIALENVFSTERDQHRLTPSQVADVVRQVNHPNMVALIDFSHAYIDSTCRGLNFLAEIAAMARSRDTFMSTIRLVSHVAILQVGIP